MKRLMPILLSLLLTLAWMPAYADDATAVYTADEYEYALNADGTATIFRYLGSADAPALPETLDGYNVTGIGAYAFFSLRGILSLAIPDSVTAIAPGAFACPNLERITAGANNPTYAQIDGVLFDKTQKLLHSFPIRGADKTYDIPPHVRLVGDRAFANCTSLTSVKIPDSVTALGESAFEGCTDLKSVTLPGSITSIGRFAFAGCESLVTAILPSGVTSLGDGMFMGCTGLISLTVPGSVTGISRDAFSGCVNLTLKVERGSFAEQYARSNGIPCQYPTDWL